MKIRVINGFYDADNHRIIEKNETIDFDEAKAKKLIALKLVVEETLKDMAEEEKESEAENESEAETKKTTAKKKK